jgi:hypothetical protein
LRRAREPRWRVYLRQSRGGPIGLATPQPTFRLFRKTRPNTLNDFTSTWRDAFRLLCEIGADQTSRAR